MPMFAFMNSSILITQRSKFTFLINKNTIYIHWYGKPMDENRHCFFYSAALHTAELSSNDILSRDNLTHVV